MLAAMNVSTHPAAQKFAAHVNPSLVKLFGAVGYGRLYTRAQGTKLWDSEGDEYLDGYASSGVMLLGHNPPKLLEKLRGMLSDDAPSRTHGIEVHAATLASVLARVTAPLTRCTFASTHSEATDCAMKLARAATKRKGLIHCKGGYHGTTLGPLSIMGHGRLRDPFEPLIPQCWETVFGDLSALDKVLGERKPAAFFVEPIQAEAGVIVPRPGYLAEARALCKKHDVLFVLDEAQTGLGRSGAMFSWQTDDVEPDILIVGDSLGGGLLPIAAIATTPEIHDRAYGRLDRFDLHGSLFSGWSLACRVATSTLRILEEEKLAAAARLRGEQLIERLRDEVADHPFVRGVRGRGLLVGLELGLAMPKSSGIFSRILPGLADVVSKRVLGQWLAVRLLEHGIVCQPATLQWNVLKIEPPLTITAPEIDQIIDSIVAVLKEYTELLPLLSDVGQRLGSQLLSTWSAP